VDGDSCKLGNCFFRVLPPSSSKSFRFGDLLRLPSYLKTIQEILTLVVLAGFSVLYLKEPLKWNYLVGFFFLVCAAFFIFKK
jgi:uncharacterized protein (DUF486 family)